MEQPDLQTMPVMGFVAPKGTGKTTLLSRVIELLTSRGLNIGVIKQARDDFDMDQPGKDSYRLRKAGIDRLLLTSSQKLALFIEHSPKRPEFGELLALFDGTKLDLILVEGFAGQAIPKIQLLRGRSERPKNSADSWTVALATVQGETGSDRIPLLDIDDPAMIAEFILDYFPTLRTRSK